MCVIISHNDGLPADWVSHFEVWQDRKMVQGVGF